MTVGSHAGYVASQGFVLQSSRITDDLTDLVFVFLFFLVGLYLIYWGADTYRLSRLIANTPTEKVASMAVGRTELEGIARPAGTVFEQPFTDGECLYVNYRIKERQKKHTDDGTEYEWVTLDSGEFGTPFQLDDGTGSVDVQATRATRYEISDENTTTITVGRGDTPPERIQQFLNGEVDGPWDPSVNLKRSRKQRYKQEVLPANEDAYVFGAAEPKDLDEIGDGAANEDRLEIVRDEGTDRFVVSDMGEEELAKGLGRRGPATILVGLLLSTGMLYVLANDLQVIFG